MPVRAGLLVAHEEVLVVDARKAEGENLAVDFPAPHQTGVTERSIGGYDGYVASCVVDEVMVGEGSDWVGARFAAKLDGEEHVIVIEIGVGGVGEGGLIDGSEHHFKLIDEAEGAGGEG